MTTRDMKRRMQAYRKGVSDMRERAIAAASQALNDINRDSICGERIEEAEAIVERIRQITIEVDR